MEHQAHVSRETLYIMATFTTTYEPYFKYSSGEYYLTQFKNLPEFVYRTAAELISNYEGSFSNDSLLDKTALNNLAIGGYLSIWKFKNGNEFLLKRIGSEGVQLCFKINNVIHEADLFSQASFFMSEYIAYLTIASRSEGSLEIVYLQSDNQGDRYLIYITTPDPASGTHQSDLVHAMLQDNVRTEDPYQFAPDNDEQGGWGSFDYSSEDDDIPSLPTISATDAGFCSLYKMTESQVKDLADYLWGLGSLASFLPIFSNPMECILSLGIVPCDPSSTSTHYIKVGNLTTTVQGALVDDQYYEVDCGSIQVNGEKFSNNFMNYSPYTKAELYLPYIGTVSLNIDEIMDSAIAIKYHIDLLSGSCVAYVKVAKYYDGSLHTNVLYQYSGNVLTNIPITSQNFTQVLQAVIGAVASGADKAAGAGLKGGVSGGMDNEINSVESFKPHIQRSGNMSASCGLLGEQTPKLVLSLPHLCRANNQGKQLGYPRYQEYTLNSLKGYTTCYKTHLTGIKCTDAEREEIISLLSSGIILPSATPVLPTLSGDKNIGVYTYTAEKIDMDKATGLTAIDTMTGTFKEDCDVLDPVITIEPTSALTKTKILNEANYVYLKDFSRTYYIIKATAKAGGLVELQLHADVLMSWAGAIRNQTVIVDRNEVAFNLFMTDGAIRTENDPYTVVMHPSGGTGFSSPHFIMAVAGSPAT